MADTDNLGEFAKGSQVILRARFRVEEVLMDPTEVTVTVEKPDGTEVTYSYAAAEVVRAGAGDFTRAQVLDQAGIWAVRWAGTGAVVVAGEDELVALRPVV